LVDLMAMRLKVFWSGNRKH